MKVLHIINSLETGGAQKLLADLLPRLNKYYDTEIKVAVFNITNSEYEKILTDCGIEVINLKTRPASVKAIWQLSKLMQQTDIAHVHLFAANYAAAFAKILTHKPLVLTEHSTHNKRRDHSWLRPVEKFVYRRFNKIACISVQTAQTLTEWIGCDIAQKRIETITNGIDIERYSNAHASSPERMFGKPGIPVLMVSRFVESKDQPTLIRAIEEIPNSEVYAVFAGDGPLKEQCIRLADELGVSDRILFLGTRNDIPEIIKASKIGVQSSHWEGFGLSALEMMAGGLPVIASDVPGLRQVVENVGATFPTGDHKSLAKEIQQLLADDTSYAMAASLGLGRAVEYSIDKTVNDYHNLYRQLL